MSERRYRSFCAATALVACALFATLSAPWAGASPQALREPPDRKAALSGRLATAARLVSEKRYDDAIALLEEICVENPGLEPAAEQLALAYLRAGKPGNAVRLLEDRLGDDPSHFPFVRMLGHAYLDLGERGKALEVWHSILDDDPKKAGYYGVIARLEMEAGFYEEAIGTYRAGRSHEALYRQFTTEIIRLERLLGRARVALEEAVGLVARNPEIDASDIDLAVELFAAAGGGAELLGVVDAASSGGNERALSVLETCLLFESGSYVEAVARLVRLGGEDEREVLAVVGYLMRAQGRDGRTGDDGALQAALEAFLERHGSSPFAPGIMLALAEDLRTGAESGPGGEGDYLEAIDLVGRILAHERSGFYSEPALLLRAEILLDGLHRPAEALESLRGVSFRAVDRSRQAERIVMRSLLAEERWEEAQRRFERLSGAADSVSAAIGLYGTGMMRFYRGEYQAALDSLSRFAERCPWSEYANDALETAMLVKEALAEGTQPLDCYRAAHVMLERGMQGPAADTLDAFRRRYPASVLLPRVLYARAGIDLVAGDVRGASELLETIPEEFPLHELAPRALERLAEIALAVGPAEAAERYEEIIERYPDDPFIGRIRSRYIELRGSGGGVPHGE